MKRALLVLLFFLASTKARADTSSSVELPIYTYAIRSGSFQVAGVLLSSFDQPIPSSLWRCAISYIPSGLTARCTYAGLGDTGVAIRASCATVRQDSQTVNLTNLDGGYASVSIACLRLDPVDDGF